MSVINTTGSKKSSLHQKKVKSLEDQTRENAMIEQKQLIKQAIERGSNGYVDTNWTNFIEIRAYGLMRSGNHAIIDWIKCQHIGHPICFLNNVKHGNCDPYTSRDKLILDEMMETTDIEHIRRKQKHLLIFSYEDRDDYEDRNVDFVSSVFDKDFARNRVRYLGTSQHQFDVLIIRDPFNFFASRLKAIREGRGLNGVTDISLIVRDWKIMAKSALSLIECPTPGKVVVNYNQWLADPNYRNRLSQTFLGNFSDDSMSKEACFGGGSSFKEDTKRLTIPYMVSQWHKLFGIRRYLNIGYYWKLLIKPKPPSLSYNDRWKFFAEDEEYKAILSDSQIIDLSNELFGEIQGTKEFMR